MSISLVKGQKIDLTKGNAGLKRVVFALGWDINRYDGARLISGHIPMMDKTEIASTIDRKNTRLNSSHPSRSRMPSSA